MMIIIIIIILKYKMDYTYVLYIFISIASPARGLHARMNERKNAAKQTLSVSRFVNFSTELWRAYRHCSNSSQESEITNEKNIYTKYMRTFHTFFLLLSFVALLCFWYNTNIIIGIIIIIIIINHMKMQLLFFSFSVRFTTKLAEKI